MPKRLNAHFETMALLSLCPWDDYKKETLIKEIDNLGVDGKEFYIQNYRLLERYYNTFEKHKINSLGIKLLQEIDEFVFAFCFGILSSSPEWFSDIGAISDDVAHEAVREAIISEGVNDNNDDIIEVLDDMALTDRAKWQFIVLQQKAGPQLRMIASAISENLPAFERACSSIQNELSNLLQHFDQCLLEPQKRKLLCLHEQIDSDAVIIPSLALPVSVLAVDDTWFYGLLSYKLLGGGVELTKDELAIGAKALSERSKMEILLCLKEKSRYNLEISELIGLTPATVSHHMNVLLASGFVELEKRDGKVYYRLAVEGINRFLTGVKHLLLSKT